MVKIASALIALLVLPAVAAADPMTVPVNAARIFVVGGDSPFATIGVWHQDRTPVIDVNITGDLFDPQPFLNLCTLCRSGDTFSPSIVVSGERLGQVSAFLGVPPNQTRFDGLGMSGSFAMQAGSITLPTEAPALFNLFLPLTLSGFLTASAGGTNVLHVEPFSFTGIAFVQFRTSPGADGGRVFTAQAFDFIASDIAAPVPEPVSLLLVGSGLAGLAFRQRRRTRSS